MVYGLTGKLFLIYDHQSFCWCRYAAYNPEYTYPQVNIVILDV